MNVLRVTVLLSLLSTILFHDAAIAQGEEAVSEGACHLGLAQSPNKLGVLEKPEATKELKTADAANSSLESTQASLWWAAKQFDPFNGKLVQNWLTKPQNQEVNIVVNWQFWTLLDYFSRYRFVNQFGTVARRYGYNLNIFNQKSQCLASYQFNPTSTPPKWELNLQGLGRGSLPIEPATAEIDP